MTITIPAWVVWVLGGGIGLVLGGLMLLGILFLWVFKDGVG